MQEMTHLLAQYGLLLVFANVFLTQLGLPVPAIPTLVVAGALVYDGQIGLAPLLVVAVAASLVGDAPWFVAGRSYGYRVLKTLCRIAIEPDSCVKQTENIFERWGARSLLVAKFIPGFATVAPPLAGAMRLGFIPFVLYTATGALLWAGASIALGMVFHAEVEWVLARLQSMGVGALVLIVAIVGGYIGIKSFERYLLIRLLRMVRISVDELHDLLQRETKPVVLDVRSATARRLDPRRIPGAIAVDIAAPEVHLAAVAPDQDVVVYCS